MEKYYQPKMPLLWDLRRIKGVKSYLVTLCLIFVSIISCTIPQQESTPTIHSDYVNDDFELYIDLPAGYSSTKEYSLVFYMDANLKLGTEIRRQIRLEQNIRHLEEVIFIGIGHIGNYRTLRRRDFIPPEFTDGRFIQSKAENFGHADNFYKFLTLELIPLINEQYPNNGRFSYIGHSFSGLFAFYCLFQPEIIFTNHIALSPSLWVNYDNIFELEAFVSTGRPEKDTYLYHAAGTGEWANKVLSTSRSMKEVLEKRAYPRLNYQYTEHKGKGHNGVVPVSLEYVLKNTDF